MGCMDWVVGGGEGAEEGAEENAEEEGKQRVLVHAPKGLAAVTQTRVSGTASEVDIGVC